MCVCVCVIMCVCVCLYSLFRVLTRVRQGWCWCEVPPPGYPARCCKKNNCREVCGVTVHPNHIPHIPHCLQPNLVLLVQLVLFSPIHMATTAHSPLTRSNPTPNTHRNLRQPSQGGVGGQPGCQHLQLQPSCDIHLTETATGQLKARAYNVA